MAIRAVPGTYSTIQAAINAAGSGDTVTITPGAGGGAGGVYSEWLTLPNKGTLADFITITTDAAAVNLPASGARTSPSYAAYMPTIQSAGAGSSTVQVAVGANHYKFQHVHFPEVPQGYNSIIAIGYGDSTQQFFTDEPTDITLDQCYIHGGAVCGQKNAISANGRRISITNNCIKDIKSVGQDSQCIAGYNGHGPLTITNNELEGGTEPYINGGADARVRTLMTLTGSPTSTSASVTCSEASHTVDQLVVGQALSVMVGTVYQFTTLRSVSGSGTSGTITFDPVAGTPAVPGGARQGCVLGAYGPGTGLTFQRNYVHQNPAWQAGVLPLVTDVAATLTTGTLAAGAWFYTVQAFSTNGYQGQTVNGAESSEVTATLSALGGIVLTWTAVSGATSYRLWRGTVTGARTQYVSVSATTKTDDGSLTWTTATPSGATLHTIKNLFELKACQYAQIDSNIFENVWYDPNANPIGFAIWMKSLNQEGTGSYVQTKEIVFEKNIIRNCFGFMELHGQEIGASGYSLPGPLTNVTVRNNWLYNSGVLPWSASHDAFCLYPTQGIVNWTLDHNTLDHATMTDNQATGSGGLMSLDSGVAHLAGVIITNNLLRRETYGIKDPTTGGDQGTLALTAAAPGYVFAKNAIAEANPATNPTNNFYDSTTLALWKANFVDYLNGDYHLKSTSPYKNAGLDGKDLGCDIDLVQAATGTTPVSNPPGIPHRRHGRFHR